MAKGFGAAKNSQNNSSKPSSLLRADDCEQIAQQWAEHFEKLSDPRGKQGVLHPFISIVMIAILATIGRARIDCFLGKSKWSRKVMRLLLSQPY